MSVQVRSRPAISGVLSVARKPGETNLKRLNGGSWPSAYKRPSMKTGSCHPLPLIGITVPMPAEETPGMASIFRKISSSMRTTRSGSLTCVSGIEMRKVCNSTGRANPTLTWVRARKVRIIKPEQIKRTSASATCTTTSTLRARCCSLLWLTPRPPSRIPVLRRTPAYLKIGTQQTSRLARIVTNNVNNRTGPSIPISRMRGSPEGATARRMRNVP